MLPNYSRLRAAQLVSSAECLKEGSYLSVCLSHAESYLTGLPLVLSPFLFVVALIAVLSLLVNKYSFKYLWLPPTANLSGIAIMCLIAASGPELRYIAPISITSALVSALWLAKLWRAGSFVARSAVCLIGALAMM